MLARPLSNTASQPLLPRPQDYSRGSMETREPTRQARYIDMLGDYILLRKLASGGMAEIYTARHIHTNELAVIKRIHRDSEEDTDMVQMFLDEAAITCALDHENLPRVLDLGLSGTAHFLALEYLRGVDTLQLLQRLGATKRGLPRKHAIALVIGACRGLQHAHERVNENGEALGIVHRDISPQNLFVTFDGGVKVLDFGIARAIERTAVTNPGTVKGKARYMSPEQCQAGNTDHRSDLFSLCTILWELTTGQPLYTGGHDLAIMSNIVSKTARKPSSVVPGYPQELEEIVMRGLDRKKRKRYQSAGELEEALLEYSEKSGLDTSSESLSNFLHSLFAQEIGIDELDSSVVDAVPSTKLTNAPVSTEVDTPWTLSDATICEQPVTRRSNKLSVLVAFACGLLLAFITTIPTEESGATALVGTASPSPEPEPLCSLEGSEFSQQDIAPALPTTQAQHVSEDEPPKARGKRGSRTSRRKSTARRKRTARKRRLASKKRLRKSRRLRASKQRRAKVARRSHSSRMLGL